MAKAQGRKITSKSEKKAQAGDVWENPEALAEQFSRTEKFFNENKGLVTIIFAAVVIIVGGIIGWRYYSQNLNEEAKSEMFQAVFYFEQDSLQLALRGDGNNLGFADIVDQYGNTRSGNLANFYAGVIHVELGNFDVAKLYLEDFSSDDLIIQSRAYSLMGDIAMEEGDYELATDYYRQAANYKANKEFTPVYLYKLAIAYEKTGNTEEARNAYKEILDKFWDADQNTIQQAKKHYARLGGEAL